MFTDSRGKFKPIDILELIHLRYSSNNCFMLSQMLSLVRIKDTLLHLCKLSLCNKMILLFPYKRGLRLIVPTFSCSLMTGFCQFQTHLFNIFKSLVLWRAMGIYESICSNRLAHGLDRLRGKGEDGQGEGEREKRKPRYRRKHRLSERQNGLLGSASFH